MSANEKTWVVESYDGDDLRVKADEMGISGTFLEAHADEILDEATRQFEQWLDETDGRGGFMRTAILQVLEEHASDDVEVRFPRDRNGIEVAPGAETDQGHVATLAQLACDIWRVTVVDSRGERIFRFPNELTVTEPGDDVRRLFPKSADGRTLLPSTVTDAGIVTSVEFDDDGTVTVLTRSGDSPEPHDPEELHVRPVPATADAEQ